MTDLYAADETEDHSIARIDTTPLVDVMLVLLIVFLITVPVVARSVALKLPAENSHVAETVPDAVTLAVTRDGRVHWNEETLAGDDALTGRLRALAAMESPPPLRLRGDETAEFAAIGHVLALCQAAGVTRLAFITEPRQPENREGNQPWR